MGRVSEWLFPDLGRRAELVLDFSSCISTVVKLISHVAALETGVVLGSVCVLNPGPLIWGTNL